MATQNVTTYEFPQLEGTSATASSPGELLASAHAEAQDIREQARAEGAAAGHAEGIAQAQAEVQSALAAASEAQRAILATRGELVENLSRQAGELALQIAQRVVVGAFEARPELVIDVARGALRRLSARHHVTVLVNPQDMELLEQTVGDFKAELGGIEHLEVQADRRVQRGGVLAQTSYGEIDATISAQLESARELVMAALDGDPTLSRGSNAESPALHEAPAPPDSPELSEGEDGI